MSKGVFGSAASSIIGIFKLADNTVGLANRVVDQGHVIVDVSEANLQSWKTEALVELEKDLKKLEKLKATA